ncbi:MAG: hypothetical protein U0793_06630 [Gemmataceae bacterium]
MPQEGKRWRHIVISTVNSWLPGDARGFRTKEHKIHSSGDYKNPPPKGEHVGLWAFSKDISGEPVVIPAAARPVAGKAILKKLRQLGHEVLAIAVAGMHAHLQVELPEDKPEAKQVIGQCKVAASHAIRQTLPGRVWARDGSFKSIKDSAHQRNVFNYILSQQDAWIWSYKDEEETSPKDDDSDSASSPRRLEDSPAGLEAPAGLETPEEG